MTTNDQNYITKVLNGDTNAYAVLVDRYKDMIYTLAYRMVKNKEEAEEIAQDTFIKAYKSLDKFKGDSKFSTWIYKVAYRTSLDRIKKLKRKYDEVAIDDVNYNQIKEIDNALDKITTEERNLAIKNCIDKLPANDSFILTLYYYEEMSLEEIAKATGMKSNNVKVKLHRSRKKLASILRQELDNETIESYDIKIRTALG